MKTPEQELAVWILDYWWVLFLAGSLICGFYTAKVAHEKGYSSGWWFLGGFLFAFVALLAAVGLPDRVRSFHVGQRVSARGVEGTVIRIDGQLVVVDDGRGQVLECKLDEIFPRA